MQLYINAVYEICTVKAQPLWNATLFNFAVTHVAFVVIVSRPYLINTQRQIKAGSDGTAAPGPTKKINLSITTH